MGKEKQKFKLDAIPERFGGGYKAKMCLCQLTFAINTPKKLGNLQFSIRLPHERAFWYNSTVKGNHMSTKCRYCGSTSYGSTCIHSPTRKHEHRDDEKHCEWCGSTSYGSTCIHSPTRKHRHGPGANKCIWCGSTSNGSGCIHSPTGKHEK